MKPDPARADWEALGVPLAEVTRWETLDFGPFEAALAHGDGFTPLSAVHYRRQLRKTADGWRRIGLATRSGLGWHRAGFGAKEATRWRSLGVDVDAARRRRDGYHPDRTEIGDRSDSASPLRPDSSTREDSL